MGLPKSIGLLWRAAALALLVLVVTGIVVAGWAVWQARGTPDYWRLVPEDDPAIEAEAARFEDRLAATVTRVGPEDRPWRVEVEATDVNRWLATRLPQWRDNDPDIALPDWLEHPMIVTRPDQLIVAGEVRVGGGTKVFSAAYAPTVDGDGVVALALSRVRIGRLWLPAGEDVTGLLTDVAGLSEGRRKELEGQLEEVRRVRLERDLGDGRVVTVHQLDLGKGGASAVCRTRGARRE